MVLKELSPTKNHFLRLTTYDLRLTTYDLRLTTLKIIAQSNIRNWGFNFLIFPTPTNVIFYKIT